ncbi:MAG: 4-diphosphocytidyl-2C-methyl-D-erythritol kinase [Synergistaceae bacterium]|nr:4-diphosphocytidyl-2C-methyl-D-erythritol kinase [Synergistaceae bacterium]
MKINLTLRVMGKRSDGYHDICSLYWRILSPENLGISYGTGADRVSVSGAEIAGENILLRACRLLRKIRGGDALPPLDLSLVKRVPPGSGVGAGSGNAAALLKWFGRLGGERPSPSDAVTLGADVAFLASDLDLALAGGVGGRLEEVPGDLDPHVVLFFPEWSSGTREAYEALDGIVGRKVLREEESRSESLDILSGILQGRRVGMLPNDFIQCFKKYESCYNSLYDMIEMSGALAWGLCGSGSACFALYERSEAARGVAGLGGASRFKWLRSMMFL